MPRLWLLLLVGLALGASVFGAPKQYDYNNLGQQDIAEIKAARHAFYAAEAAGMQEAIRERLERGDMLLEGNQADYDVRYYGLNIKLNFIDATVEGQVDYKIRSSIAALSAVDLNLHDQLVVDSIKFGDTPAAFTRANNLLSITTPTAYATNVEFDFSVYYHGVPYYDGQRGMTFSYVSGYPMCFTFCSPFAARHWWPCKDHMIDKPDSMDIFVDYPAAYKVASNGVIVSDAPSGVDRKLVHYKHMYPIATYLVAIACADFVFDQQTWNYGPYSTPVVTYTLPNATDSKAAFDTWMLPVLTHLSDKFGTYPFATEKAGSANFGWGGAMENQTCSFYLPTFYDSWVIAHETSHQWWGDMLSAKTFNHVWLKEGFASYSESIFFESYYDSLAAYLGHMQTQKYLGPGTVYVENLDPDSIFDGNLTYDKGSWVVHMLRGVLGDTTFFRVIGDYYNSQYRFNSLTTEDFAALVSTSVGTDMTWYFNEWIYGDGHPDYQITWHCQRDTSGGFDLYYFVKQTQTGTQFRMPIRTQFVTTATTKDTIIWNEGREQFYSLHFADSVTNVVVDPQEWILRTVETVLFGMRMVTTVPPQGETGKPYNWKLQVAGGVAPYTWTQFGGDLPYGLSLSSDGTLSGTPTYASTFYYTLQVADASIPPNTETRDFAHVIKKAVLIGDANGSGHVDISDAVFLIAYIFAGGPAPNPLVLGDADCSGFIDISDPVFIVAYIFGGGPAPQCP